MASVQGSFFFPISKAQKNKFFWSLYVNWGSFKKNKVSFLDKILRKLNLLCSYHDKIVTYESQTEFKLCIGQN